LVAALEKALGVPAKVDFRSKQPGDVPFTAADLTKAKKLLGWQPRTSLDEGLARYAAWVRSRP
jgi:UDP-glucuronate 4-epimerase